MEGQTVSASSETSGMAFLFDLPEVGLALRSVSIVDDKPQFSFEPADRVPTLQEGDVATAFRLASENVRPGFAYVNFPPFHPLESRWYMWYSPDWLRWTGIGQLLADADWNMKCLHVGAKTNEEKTVYKSWPKSSKLKGLGTKLDFPLDPDSTNPTIWMSCEEAEIQEGENKIFFPKEPKIKITSGTRPLYSDYITRVLPSVAFHDEPKLLKVQEVIKLILAVEWLWEKGIRVNEDWVLMHTSKSMDGIKNQRLLEKRKRPPRKMIPKGSSAERPPLDVTPTTTESEEINALVKENSAKKYYGFYDCCDAAMTVFDEKGVKVCQQECLKISIQDKSSLVFGAYVPVDEKYKLSKFKGEFLKALPECRKAIADVSETEPPEAHVKDCSTKAIVKLKVKNHPLDNKSADTSSSDTAVITVTKGNDYDQIFAGMNPNDPIRPEIPGICDAVIPNVDSWEELISKFTVPRPSVWLFPVFETIGLTTSGGVSTKDFPVRRSPLEEMERDRRVEVRDSYMRVGRTLSVRAEHVVAQGEVRLVAQHTIDFIQIKDHFTVSWKKGSVPKVSFVFAISNQFLFQEWSSYRQVLKGRGHSQEDEVFYHGTILACDIVSSKKLCSAGNCGICGIICAGMDPNCIRKNSFQRFGNGFYLAPHSSKCHDYNSNGRRYRAMLRCNVLPGQKDQLWTTHKSLKGPRNGCDSVYGAVGDDLNYPEIVVYDKRAVLPTHIIGYHC